MLLSMICLFGFLKFAGECKKFDGSWSSCSSLDYQEPVLSVSNVKLGCLLKMMKLWNMDWVCQRERYGYGLRLLNMMKLYQQVFPPFTFASSIANELVFMYPNLVCSLP